MKLRSRTFNWKFNRLTALSLAVTSLALLAAAIVMPLSTTPAYADHDSTYVVCPDAIPEGEWDWMRVRKPGHRIRYVTVFTYNGNYTASGNDYYEYHSERIESRTGENSVWVPVGALEDTETEHDETFSIGFWVEGTWHGCVVTIDDDDTPEITFVDISSSPPDGIAYRDGDSIDVTVNMDGKVEVDGTPLLSLYIDREGDSAWRGAKYHSGSGTRSLVFRYEVQPEDLDYDGITVSSAAQNDDGSPAHGFSGNIFAEGTDVPINYTHAGVNGDRQQKVDGRPYVQNAQVTSSPPDGWQAYRANQIIEASFTFNTDVVVEGEVTVDMRLGLDGDNWDEATRKAAYVHGSGADTLVFGYTVQPGDMDTKGIKIALGIVLGDRQSGFGGSGTIKAKGTDVERHPFYYATDHLPGHKVDSEPPSISSVNIKSGPANGEAYSAGEHVNVEVVFSEDVTPSGDVHLELDVGGVTRQATLQSVPEHTFNDSLAFQYTVREGDADADGIGIGANSVKLNGGGIHDIAGNSAGLSHDAVVADSGQKVNAATED